MIVEEVAERFDAIEGRSTSLSNGYSRIRLGSGSGSSSSSSIEMVVLSQVVESGGG